MGQRLVIQITENGEPLANAYYHWSAYTCSAAELTNKVLGYLDDADKSFTNKQKAVWALYKTGARFAPDELNRIDKVKPFSFVLDDKQVNRNDGLLCISQDGMEQNIDWEEGRVDIDIVDKEIYFDVISIEDAKDYTAYEATLDEEDRGPSIESMPTLDMCEELEFTPEEWAKFYTRLMQIHATRKYYAVSSDKTTVYTMIA